MVGGFYLWGRIWTLSLWSLFCRERGGMVVSQTINVSYKELWLVVLCICC